jgi:predicted hydrocarbon binding protein
MNDAGDDDDVTLPSGLVLDLVDECRHLGLVARPLIKMTSHLDPARPQERCSIDTFNDAADWIERELGMTSVRLAGRQIGHRYFAAMRTLGLAEAPTTMMLMRELESTSRTIVYDPEGRGWDLVRHDARSAVVRNTQEINCVLSEGLLLSLMDRTPAVGAQVHQTSCVRRGDDTCDYEITWSGERDR